MFKLFLYSALAIIASELDESSERIVQYLSCFGVKINVFFFSYFKKGDKEFLGRSWLIDPEKIEAASAPGKKHREPWTGYYYMNVGKEEDNDRNWDDCRKYRFLGACGGPKWINQVKGLSKGNKVFAYLSGHGYVGYGAIVAEAVPVKDFAPEGQNGKRLLECDLTNPKIGENVDDLDKCEWVVGVEWIKDVSREDAKTFKGIFANQSIVCKIRQRATVEFLMDKFGISEV